jgi:hypothetical protein
MSTGLACNTEHDDDESGRGVGEVVAHGLGSPGPLDDLPVPTGGSRRAATLLAELMLPIGACPWMRPVSPR